MSDIDFQNGFICGMATKGLIRSGNLYEPLVWNDEGIYEYFYIDFKGSLDTFSLGMFQESIILHDSIQFPIDAVAEVSPGVYKVYCFLEDKIKGVTVLNKTSTLLNFSSGRRVPPFSVQFFVSGLAKIVRKVYRYEVTNAVPPELPLSTVGVEVTYPETFETQGYETVPLVNVNLANSTAALEVLVTYWPS